ncbi:hypothetical protein ACJJTC_003383 [Scirpophaga incertulas]
MEEVLRALQKIQQELDEQKITIQKSGENVTERVTHNINTILDEKFKILEEKYENLKDKVENQEKRLYFLEKQARQTKYNHRDIQEARRIGKKGERPRPIILTISTLGTKIEIFKHKKVLEDTSFYIKEDYPEYVLKKRKELQDQVQIEKEKGNSVRIKYDKLVIINKNSDTPNHNKRMLSSSPENSSTCEAPRDKNKMQMNKKNKTEGSIRRSSSLSEGPIKPGILNYLHANTSSNFSRKQENKNNNL